MSPSECPLSERKPQLLRSSPVDPQRSADPFRLSSTLTPSVIVGLLATCIAACGSVTPATATPPPSVLEEAEAPPPPPPPPRVELPVHSITEIAVVSFNVRHESLDQGANAWPARRDLVFAAIRERAPDLVGIQEASRGQVEELVRALPRYGAVGVGSEAGDARGVHAAIMFRLDRFEIEDRGVFWLSDEPDRPGSTSWGNREPRICIWARLRERLGGRTVAFFNTHLDHRAAESRTRGLALIAERIREHEGLPVIFTGDFNVDAEDEVITGFLERAGLLDTLRAVAGEPIDEMGTYHGFEGSDDGRRVDLVLVSQGVRVLEAGIVRDQRDGRFPSDHFPVFGRVQIGAF